MGDNLQQSGTSVAAIDGPARPSMANKCSIDGPAVPVVAGDHLQRDRPAKVGNVPVIQLNYTGAMYGTARFKGHLQWKNHP